MFCHMIDLVIRITLGCSCDLDVRAKSRFCVEDINDSVCFVIIGAIFALVIQIFIGLG